MKLLTVLLVAGVVIHSAAFTDGATTTGSENTLNLEDFVHKIPEERIVGGVPAIQHEFPHQLSLQYGNSHFCGAVLLNQNWALTAAHCLHSDPPQNYRVVAGAHDLLSGNGGEQASGISSAVIHEAYNVRSMVNDIALLQLTTPMSIAGPYVKGISYPTFAQGLTTSVNATVTGWGTTSSGASSGSRILRKVTVPTLTDANCRTTGYDSAEITDDMICAGFANGGKDSCQGDSGGPLIANVAGGLKLIGIVSFGIECALPNYPGVYTEVSRYANWIDSIINP